MVDAGWVVGWLLLAATALKPTVAELRRSDDEEEPSITRLALPYAPLIVAAVTGLGIQITTGEFEPFLVFTGTVIGLLVISRQIVALIENRQLNARLRATVMQLSEREQELKDGLRRELAAADQLRAIDDLKDTFLRAVSHDLRTPLTAMLGVAVTLERTRLNLPREQALDLVGMLVEKTRKLERLLKDLLDLNRLEEGVLEPNRSLTDVRELVHRVVTEVDQLAGWPIDIEAEPIQAFIDGPKVERIVENLLLNTTRHTPPGTRVWVKALARGSDLELIVEDAGPGVPAELAGTIFEAFRRAGGPGPAPTMAHHRGVGIGLSLVARFAASSTAATPGSTSAGAAGPPSMSSCPTWSATTAATPRCSTGSSRTGSPSMSRDARPRRARYRGMHDRRPRAVRPRLGLLACPAGGDRDAGRGEGAADALGPPAGGGRGPPDRHVRQPAVAAPRADPAPDLHGGVRDQGGGAGRLQADRRRPPGHQGGRPGHRAAL